MADKAHKKPLILRVSKELQLDCCNHSFGDYQIHYWRNDFSTWDLFECLICRIVATRADIEGYPLGGL